ncbi:Iron/zinc purple acid phosphatase-like C-terminal domain, partial [Dillenia turbinata]
VHITQGDHVGRSVIVSWVTPMAQHPDTVRYWAAEGKDKHKHITHSMITTYRYFNYSSGYIHHATIKRLEERISNVRYNITNGLSTPVKNASAPVYITIGDGGNIEGIANSFTEPQPDYSAYREASFGHGILEIKNRTHAQFTWHRNQDNEAVASDSVWFYNRFWYPEDDSNSGILKGRE